LQLDAPIFWDFTLSHPARRTADKAGRNRFNQKLAQDVGVARADRHAHADLLHPLVDLNQHHVRPADSAHGERDIGDGRDQQREDGGDRGDALPDIVGVKDAGQAVSLSSSGLPTSFSGRSRYENSSPSRQRPLNRSHAIMASSC
jgi:hypothetical protein